MTPIGFKVPFFKGRSLYVEEWCDEDFFKAVHFHEEYQLTYILNGEGILKVGSEEYAFCAGECYLLGKNLPHVFRNLRKNADDAARCISVFFNAESIYPILNQHSEALPVLSTLQKAGNGLRLDNRLSSEVLDFMCRLGHLQGINSLIELLFMFEKIANEGQNEELVNEYGKSLNHDEYGLQKLDKIFHFIEGHYSKKIALEDIAEKFNMNPSSFCRFFKSRTQKTFSQFLIEMRVAKACELMRVGAHNATETCFNTGFTNLSNFHRQFKNVIGMTPSQYRESVASF